MIAFAACIASRSKFAAFREKWGQQQVDQQLRVAADAIA
jgi:hypothetical protein